MVPAATLKAFEPLAAFTPGERDYWEEYAAGGASPPTESVLLSRELGLRGNTATMVAEREHAEIIDRRAAMFVCPHRTRLRLLASVLAFRRSIPAEVVGAFMPPDEVERATDEIETLRSAHPAWRNHILESSWEVPLHWFVAFDAAERAVLDRGSGVLTIRYETVIRAAKDRCARALEILEVSLPNPVVIAPIAGMARWLEEFDPGSLLALDYAGLARLMSQEDLRRDLSCRDVWASITALSEGDGERAAAHYMVVAERWGAMRRRESWN
jgi:hypothetical protein